MLSNLRLVNMVHMTENPELMWKIVRTIRKLYLSIHSEEGCSLYNHLIDSRYIKHYTDKVKEKLVENSPTTTSSPYVYGAWGGYGSVSG